jgi:hypothetical protein
MCFFSWDDLQNGPAPQGMWTRRLRDALFVRATKPKNLQSVANEFGSGKYEFLSGMKMGRVTEDGLPHQNATCQQIFLRKLFSDCRWR